ncbi:MAG: MBL fold metallo-hydrolase [Spirochaetia bacterium]|nr:MBL fold metallo-hydrolase [Spirochaetia bacterium]
MIRITTLIENTQGEHLALKSEHGISFCIETPGHKIIFDTGQSGKFIENADQLRISLDDVEYAVLSHGHYDHSGGLRELIKVNSSFELVAGEGFFNEKYACKNGRYEFLGNNFSEDFLKENKIRYKLLSRQVRELVPDVFVLGSFPRIHRDELINPRFNLLTDKGFIPDRFDDEVMIVIDTPKGLIAVLGCSHPGMRNMLDEAKSRFAKPLYAVLGGTHLVEASEESAAAAASYLMEEQIEVIGVSHCTGKIAVNMLEKNGGRYFHNRTGSSLVLDL